MDAVQLFYKRLGELESPKIVEFGTRRSKPEVRTCAKDLIAKLIPGAEHIGTDFEPGLDVDVVADAHHLLDAFQPAGFDAFISNSVFEHLRWPWVAVLELNRVLKTGGIGFVQTHQTFPIHGYPNDYFRYTTEGLSSLFCEELGWKVLKTDYSFPAKIVPPPEVSVWDEVAQSFLNVNIFVEKTAEIDDERFRWPVGREQSKR